MKSKWKVTSQYVGEEKIYQVYRLRDINAVDHSGNREYVPKFITKDEELAELGRGKADVVKQIKARQKELKGNSNLTQKEGLRHLSRQNTGKFSIQMPKNIIPVIVNEETSELKQAVGAEDTPVEINLRTIAKSAAERKER